MFTFCRDRKQHEVASTLSRIINQSTHELEYATGDARSKRRYHRTLPVLVGPWVEGEVDLDELTVAITNNVSEHGVALSVPKSWSYSDVLCGFWCETAIFLRGQVKHRLHLGAQFWQIGVELTSCVRLAELSNLDEVCAVARALEPHSIVPAE